MNAYKTSPFSPAAKGVAATTAKARKSREQEEKKEEKGGKKWNYFLRITFIINRLLKNYIKPGE